jgi:hypothetical protein
MRNPLARTWRDVFRRPSPADRMDGSTRFILIFEEGQEMSTRDEQIRDPEFVQGQIAAVRSLVIAVANLLPKEEFERSYRERFESLKAAIVPQPVGEGYLDGIADVEYVIDRILR